MTIPKSLALLPLLAAAPLTAQEFSWRQDLDAARAVASASGKPLLVLFRCEP